MRYSRSHVSTLFKDRFGPPTVTLSGNENWGIDKTLAVSLSRAHVFCAVGPDDKRDNMLCSFSTPLSVIDNIDIPNGNPGDVVRVRFLDGDGAELATFKMNLKKP